MKNVLVSFFLTFPLSGFTQQAVHDFTLTNVIDGSSISLNAYPSCSGLVVLFTSNECAFDNYYTTRIKSLVDGYAGKIQFILINSYVEPAESPEKMEEKYKTWNLHIPYLADKDQIALDCLGAKKSPEVFLLKNVSGKYFQVYNGAIDDNAQVASDVKQNYLKESIEKLLAGQKIDVPTVRAVGCSIRRK